MSAGGPRGRTTRRPLAGLHAGTSLLQCHGTSAALVLYSIRWALRMRVLHLSKFRRLQTPPMHDPGRHYFLFEF